MSLTAPDPRTAHYVETGVWGRVTLDALFRRNLARTPDRIALVDGPDRETWTDGAPRRLTYRQADQSIATLAARFQELGLRPGALIAIQLPNVVELPITVLAAARAGLLPALVPLLWRTREIATAMEPLSPKAFVGIGRAGDDQPADLLRYAAAELFSVRFVLAFGRDLPDGVMGLDDTQTGPGREPRAVAVPGSPGEEPALVTFRTTASGHAAVVRTHNHWVSAGLASVLEARLEPGEIFASAMMPASFGTVSTTILPWLLTGGTLLLHQPFDPAVFAETITTEGATRAIVAGPMLPNIMPSLTGLGGAPLKSVTAVYADARALSRRKPHPFKGDIVDITALDEWAILARRRKAGEPRPLPAGSIRQPTDGGNGPTLVETRVLSDGRLAVRGPMVPFDPQEADGFRATGIMATETGGQLAVTGRTDQVAFVGGLGVGAEELERHLLESEDVDAVRVVAIADPLFGERIEAHVAPRATAPLNDEAVVEKLHGRLAVAGLSPHKIPSRIVMDHMVRADPRSRLRPYR